MKAKLRKKKFTKEDDLILKEAIRRTPNWDWKEIAAKTGKYTARQCRERWNNYINPKLLKTEWTPEEDEILQNRYKEFGSNWVKIQTYLPGRAVNSIKLRLSVLQSNSHQDTAEFEDYYNMLKIENFINTRKSDECSID